MKKGIEYKRKREGKTDYRKRLKILLGNKPRIVIRKSLKNIVMQIIEYSENGDKVVVAASSKELEKKYGLKFNRGNIPCAYLTGYLLGKKAVKKNIKDAVLDSGFAAHIKGSKIYAGLKGAIDGGIKVKCSEDVFPKPEMIKGTHIANYASKIKDKKEEYEKRFSGYIKKGIKPEDIPKYFDEVKNKIV